MCFFVLANINVPIPIKIVNNKKKTVNEKAVMTASSRPVRQVSFSNPIVLQKMFPR